MNEVRLSERADADLVEVFEFGIERFGIGEAIAYRDGLRHSLGLLAEQPQMGRMVPEIAPDLRRHVYRRHVILYEIMPGYVLVHAIVDGSNVTRLKL